MKSGLNINLDDVKSLTEFDASNCHTSIKNFPDQLKSAWTDAKKLDLGALSSGFSSVYFCGMGGSAYPGRIAEYLYKNSLNVPFEVVDNYNLPNSANPKSLVFCASYSGNTEETLSCASEALKRGLNVIGITTGGALADLIERHKMPVFKFEPVLNPSNQPRMGQGYMIAAAFALFSSLSLIKDSDSEFSGMIKFLAENDKNLNWDNNEAQNPAKILAREFSSKIINFVAAEFLEGTVHAVRNPINETGKHFASYFIIPEINHHLLEGLAYPESIKNNILFAFIDSPLYPAKIRKRFSLTREVMAKNHIESIDINLRGDTKLKQTFELIQLLSFVSFYLAAVHGINPAPVPWVDFFKNNLK